MKKYWLKTVGAARVSLSLMVAALFVTQPCAAFVVREDVVSDREATSISLSTDQRISQVLARLTFGARPEDVERIRSIGIKQFIDTQLDPDSIDDAALQKRLDKLPTLTLSNPTIAEQYNPPKPKPTPTPTPVATAGTEMSSMATQQMAPMSDSVPAPVMSPTPKPSPTPVPKTPAMVVTELQRAKLLRTVYSERQLYEVMVDFWENHFSIYANKDADRLLLTGFDRDSVRPFALGRFRDLLGATAHSPAMMFYLDNWQSTVVRQYPATKDKPARQTGGINENYARELMELHTLGVNGGYTQKDVQEVARCFTGWTIRKPNEEGIFYYNPAQHDNGEKVVLGVKIAAGGGIGDAEKVLDILARHPSTASFVATKLARRLIGDDPPKPVVDRAAQAFLKSDGSIRETLKSILDSPEFYSPKFYQSKVRSPFEYVAAALRATAAETDANRPVLDWIGRMGQPVFGRITPDGYPDRGSQWLSNNDMLARFNFAVALSTNAVKGTRIDLPKLISPAPLTDSDAIIAALTRTLLMDQISPTSKAALERAAKTFTAGAPAQNQPVSLSLAANPVAAKTTANDLVSQLLALTLGTPEFQRK